MLVEKFIRNITLWATKTISYAGRVALVNSVLMGVFTFWATIFIFPKGVIKELERLCRNYLWGVDESYRKIPYVSWDETCKPKKFGGLCIRNLEGWNKARIAKLVLAVAKKKDILWVKCMKDTWGR